MFKVDLHTHSEASSDGGITPDEYADLLRNERLDVIAITDHNRIDFAVGLQKALGKDKIIVGEEISTLSGDIVGLYLTKLVKPGLPLEESVKQIKDQGGLVYIPHAFETIRKGLQEADLESIKNEVDIIETFNGRAFAQNHGPKATVWARQNNKAEAASSDAHGKKGAGDSYTILRNRPSKSTLVHELKTAKLTCKHPPIHTLLYPKFNRLKNMLGIK